MKQENNEHFEQRVFTLPSYFHLPFGTLSDSIYPNSLDGLYHYLTFAIKTINVHK